MDRRATQGRTAPGIGLCGLAVARPPASIAGLHARSSTPGPRRIFPVAETLRRCHRRYPVTLTVHRPAVGEVEDFAKGFHSTADSQTAQGESPDWIETSSAVMSKSDPQSLPPVHFHETPAPDRFPPLPRLAGLRAPCYPAPRNTPRLCFPGTRSLVSLLSPTLRNALCPGLFSTTLSPTRPARPKALLRSRLSETHERARQRPARPRRHLAPPTAPPLYGRPCPCRGLPQPEVRRAGVYYGEDVTTGKQTSLRTKDETDRNRCRSSSTRNSSRATRQKAN